MNSLEELTTRFADIEGILSYSFQNRELLSEAFVHRSFMNENRNTVEKHNERLEFLGDAVLTLIISEFLFMHLPIMREGDLSHLRSQLIDASACAGYLKKLRLHEFILLGKGETQGDPCGKESIYSDLFEAILGAIYLDGGIRPAREFVIRHFQHEILQTIENPAENWKAKLQDYSQRKFREIPIYKITDIEGPDHQKTFHVTVFVGGEPLGKGLGSSKKKAEQLAAQKALAKIYGEEDG
jgi:ribonuclease-3